MAKILNSHHRYFYSIIAMALLVFTLQINIAHSQTLSDVDLSRQIIKSVKNPGAPLPKGPRYSFKAVTSQGYLIAISVPTPGKEWANSRLRVSCDKYTGDKIPTAANGLYTNNLIFEVSAPRDFSLPDDSGSYEEMKTPFLLAFFSECNIKKLPDSELNNSVREVIMRNQNEVIRVGPTFTCSDYSKCDPLSQVIIAGAHGKFEMGALDVGLVQPYQAMRAIPDVDQNALKVDAGRFAQQVKTQCRLPKRFKTNEAHGTLDVPDSIVQCVADLYKKQRVIWSEKAKSYNNADLNEEIARSPSDHWFSQYLMLLNGFLPKQGWPESAPAPLDGSFGAGTRNSIRAVQAEAGLPTSGFMTNATFNYLLTRDTNKAATPAPAVTPVANTDVKYTGFRWDYRNWQGYATAKIINSAYTFSISCEQLMPVMKITVERRGKDPGDDKPVSSGSNVRLQVASTSGSAVFGMDKGVAEAFGTIGTQELNKAFYAIQQAREFSVEIPDLSFATKFSTLSAKDAIESLREDCELK